AKVDGHRQRVDAEGSGGEEPLDLVAPHRAVLVARQADDIGVRIPPLEGADVPLDMPSEDDPLTRDRIGKPASGAHWRDGIPSPPCVAGARSPSALPTRPRPPRRRRSSPSISAG